MPSVEFHLRTLGEFSLRRAARPDETVLRASKPLMLVALLAMAPRQTARREHLAALLWPDSEPVRARRSLRQALFYFSKRAAPQLLQSENRRSTVVLDTARLSIDVWDFDTALRERRYVDAIALHRGEFLREMSEKLTGEVEQLIGAERARIQSGLQVAYTRLVCDGVDAGDTERAIAYAREYAAAYPRDERAHAMLLHALRVGGYELEALGTHRLSRWNRPPRLSGGPPAVPPVRAPTSVNGGPEPQPERRIRHRIQRAFERVAGLCGLNATRAVADGEVGGG